MKYLSIFLLCVILDLQTSYQEKHQKYLRIISAEPAVTKFNWIDQSVDLTLDIDDTHYQAFQQINNKNKYTEGAPRNWNLITSIDDMSLIVFNFETFFSGSFQIMDLRDLENLSIDDNFTLHNEDPVILLNIKLKFYSIDPIKPFTLMSIINIYILKRKSIQITIVALNQIIENSFYHSHNFYYMNNHPLSYPERPYFDNIYFYMISEKKNLLSLKIENIAAYDKHLKENFEYIHMGDFNLKFAPFKYYRYSIEDNNVFFAIIIHNEFYKSVPPSFESYCKENSAICQNQSEKNNNSKREASRTFDKTKNDTRKLICRIGQTKIKQLTFNNVSINVSCACLYEKIKNGDLNHENSDGNNKCGEGNSKDPVRNIICLKNVYCQNNGSCEIKNYKRKCKCIKGFTGRVCEINCQKMFSCEDCHLILADINCIDSSPKLNNDKNKSLEESWLKHTYGNSFRFYMKSILLLIIVILILRKIAPRMFNILIRTTYRKIVKIKNVFLRKRTIVYHPLTEEVKLGP